MISPMALRLSGVVETTTRVGVGLGDDLDRFFEVEFGQFLAVGGAELEAADVTAAAFAGSLRRPQGHRRRRHDRPEPRSCRSGR